MGAGTKPFFFTLRVVFHCWVQIRRHTDPSTHTPEMCVCVSPPLFFYVLLCSTIVYETERRERFFLIFVTILFFFMICKFVVDFHVLDKLKFKTGWDVLWSRMT